MQLTTLNTSEFLPILFGRKKYTLSRLDIDVLCVDGVLFLLLLHHTRKANLSDLASRESDSRSSRELLGPLHRGGVKILSVHPAVWNKSTALYRHSQFFYAP